MAIMAPCLFFNLPLEFSNRNSSPLDGEVSEE